MREALFDVGLVVTIVAYHAHGVQVRTDTFFDWCDIPAVQYTFGVSNRRSIYRKTTPVVKVGKLQNVWLRNWFTKIIGKQYLAADKDNGRDDNEASDRNSSHGYYPTDRVGVNWTRLAILGITTKAVSHSHTSPNCPADAVHRPNRSTGSLKAPGFPGFRFASNRNQPLAFFVCRTQGSVKTWLTMITRSRAIDRLRSLKIAREPAMQKSVLESSPGVLMQPLKAGNKHEQSECALISIEPGSFFPSHNHLGDEWGFILQGTAREDSGCVYNSGDIVYQQAGSSHIVSSIADTPLIFIVMHQGVVFSDKCETNHKDRPAE